MSRAKAKQQSRQFYQNLASADQKRRGLAANTTRTTTAPASRQGDRADSEDDPASILKSIAETVENISLMMNADAYSIEQFCARHSISVPMYYKLRLNGLGPREMNAGARVLITKEAAEEWRRDGVEAHARKLEAAAE
jgi:hypothetical protein